MTRIYDANGIAVDSLGYDQQTTYNNSAAYRFNVSDYKVYKYTNCYGTWWLVYNEDRNMSVAGQTFGAEREYRIYVKNCYEDLYVTNGNMTNGGGYCEIVMSGFNGVYPGRTYAPNWQKTYAWRPTGNDEDGDDNTMYLGYLIGQNGTGVVKTLYVDQEVGYGKPKISLKNRAGTSCFAAETSSSGNILYQVRTDNGGTDDDDGEPTLSTVSYSDWVASDDGHWYFSISENFYTDTMNNRSTLDDSTMMIYVSAGKKNVVVNYDTNTGDGLTTGPKDVTFEGNATQTYSAGTSIKLESSIEDKDRIFQFDGWEILGTNGESVPNSETGNGYTLITGLFPAGVMDLSQQTEVDKLQGYVSLDSNGNSDIKIRARWSSRENTSALATVKLNYYLYQRSGSGNDTPSSTTLLGSDTIKVPVGSNLVSQLYGPDNDGDTVFTYKATNNEFSDTMVQYYENYNTSQYTTWGKLQVDTANTFGNGSSSTASTAGTGLMKVLNVTKNDTETTGTAGNSYTLNVYVTYPAEPVVTGIKDMDKGYWLLLILTLTALAAVTTAMIYRRRYGAMRS